jgi:hypothetical protein
MFPECSPTSTSSNFVDSAFQRRKRKLVWGTDPTKPAFPSAHLADSSAPFSLHLAGKTSEGRSTKAHEERSLSRTRLRQLLDAYGEFPQRHRLRIWR